MRFHIRKLLCLILRTLLNDVDAHELRRNGLAQPREMLRHRGLAEPGDRLELADRRFDPFWKRAEELGALVFLHPQGFTEPKRLEEYFLENAFGQPLETALAPSCITATPTKGLVKSGRGAAGCCISASRPFWQVLHSTSPT